MPHILVASDSAAVREDVKSVLSGQDTVVTEVTRGSAVAPAIRTNPPDLVVLDLQIGNMGGMATCLDLRLEESADRLPHVGVLMLLDRRADVFLARRAGAEGWIVKPLDPLRLRRAINEVLAGRTYHDASYQPAPTFVGAAEGPGTSAS
ncbi:MAG TPA: response regulator [Acidimicrobiales bacterium]|nr:response regulator [Acidimicrobiales bacterium]